MRNFNSNVLAPKKGQKAKKPPFKHYLGILKIQLNPGESGHWVILVPIWMTLTICIEVKRNKKFFIQPKNLISSKDISQVIGKYIVH